ncbi:MAG TPA: hypothetical protein VFI11_10540 [Anaerolineales bacterium]|nr:hypothetical protein [Anaerolineales bacterium]
MRRRLPLLAASLLSLLIGLWVGLVRMGWALPVAPPSLPLAHGPIMVSGFLGTLIALERAVALNALRRQSWPYAAPALSALGVIVLIAGFQTAAAWLFSLAALVFAAASLLIWRMQPGLHTGSMAAGAVAWLSGNALWAGGRAPADIVPWWMAYVVLTIAGERLDLGRILRIPEGWKWAFGAVVIVILAALPLADAQPQAGALLLGVSLLVLAGWLFAHDIARRNIRQPGLTGYIARCMLMAYGWLAVAGLLRAGLGPAAAGFVYDSQVHALFLGFTFSMVFGHAPIILPAITGRSIVYAPGLNVPLILLQASLVLRLAGDFAARSVWRQWGGILGALAIVGFFGLMALSLLRSADTG